MLRQYVNAPETDSEFIAQCEAEAEALVARFVGSATVPASVLERARLEVGSELYHRRQAPNGVAQFTTFDGAAVRVARDPMVGAYPLLSPFNWIGDRMRLPEYRTEIAELLKAEGLPAFDHLPGRITPPCVVLSAGSPYLEPSGAFGEFLGRWQLTVIAATGENSVATDALDLLIEDAVVAMANAHYSIETTSKPYALEVNGAAYAAADINIKKNVRF